MRIILINRSDMSMETRFQETMHASGLRATRQRQLLLDVIHESPGHLDAEAIHRRVQEREPRIGLATVYRTLALFKEMGLIQEQRLGEEHGHFETVSKEPHYHFACLKCGQVIEFDDPRIVDVVRALSKKEGLRVSDVHLLLRGYCAACRTMAG
jgi:Fur family ferric uptake transcriptional regulator